MIPGAPAPHPSHRVAAGDIDPSYLATHHLPLDQGAQGCEMFKRKDDGCLRVVFSPG